MRDNSPLQKTLQHEDLHGTWHSDLVLFTLVVLFSHSDARHIVNENSLHVVAFRSARRIVNVVSTLGAGCIAHWPRGAKHKEIMEEIMAEYKALARLLHFSAL